jgi:hypothetical protein
MRSSVLCCLCPSPRPLERIGEHSPVNENSGGLGPQVEPWQVQRDTDDDLAESLSKRSRLGDGREKRQAITHAQAVAEFLKTARGALLYAEGDKSFVETARNDVARIAKQSAWRVIEDRAQAICQSRRGHLREGRGFRVDG